MRRVWVVLGFVLGLVGAVAKAQQNDDIVWLQIEARPSLAEATQRARSYAGRLPDVAGFAIGGNWHAVMLGPYLRGTGEDLRDQLIAQGRIPFDSYLTGAQGFGPQFWPLDDLEAAAAVTSPATVATPIPVVPLQTPPVTDTPDPASQEAVAQSGSPDAVPNADRQTPDPASALAGSADASQTGDADGAANRAPDETPQEARASEAQLTGAEKRTLQKALKAEGFYRATIDGAIGPGTRRAMAAWQRAQAMDPTGVLTTAQREQLMEVYMAPLRSVGMQPVEDRAAGIKITLPMGIVTFDGYTPPFSQFSGSEPLLGAEVLLISQAGDRARLAALYKVIQTLDILPEAGPRDLQRSRFTIEGQSAGRIGHAEAWVNNGEIKGFVLGWPSGDEPRRLRVLEAMRNSYEPLPGVLPEPVLDAAPDLDLLVGNPRATPLTVRSGVWIDDLGHIFTSVQASTGCARMTLGDGTALRLLGTDTRLGVSLLKAETGRQHVQSGFAGQSLPSGTRVAVAGFPLGIAASWPVLSHGTLSDTGGAAAGGVIRMALEHQPGDIGGPVLDQSGRLIGVLLAGAEETRVLPDGLSVAADVASLGALLDAAGIHQPMSDDTAKLSAEALDSLAKKIAVRVQCWPE